jgi:hypothetical protein
LTRRRLLSSRNSKTWFGRSLGKIPHPKVSTVALSWIRWSASVLTATLLPVTHNKFLFPVASPSISIDVDCSSCQLDAGLQGKTQGGA